MTGMSAAMSRKEMEEYIAGHYSAEAEQPWDRYPEYRVFRHRSNRKWFAVLMTVPKSRLGLEADGDMDILNLKCGPLMAGSLRTEPGIYPAYHMNKANWISAALDGSVSLESLGLLLDISYELTAPRSRRGRQADACP